MVGNCCITSYAISDGALMLVVVPINRIELGAPYRPSADISKSLVKINTTPRPEATELEHRPSAVTADFIPQPSSPHTPELRRTISDINHEFALTNISRSTRRNTIG